MLHIWTRDPAQCHAVARLRTAFGGLCRVCSFDLMEGKRNAAQYYTPRDISIDRYAPT